MYTVLCYNKNPGFTGTTLVYLNVQNKGYGLQISI